MKIKLVYRNKWTGARFIVFANDTDDDPIQARMKSLKSWKKSRA